MILSIYFTWSFNLHNLSDICPSLVWFSYINFRIPFPYTDLFFCFPNFRAVFAFSTCHWVVCMRDSAQHCHQLRVTPNLPHHLLVSDPMHHLYLYVTIHFTLCLYCPVHMVHHINTGFPFMIHDHNWKTICRFENSDSVEGRIIPW